MPRVDFKIFVDDEKSMVGFDAVTSNGRKLSRLESAHILSKVVAGLIKDGITETGQSLIVPPTKNIPNIRTS